MARRRAGARWCAALALLCASTACIIPDNNIDVRAEKVNPGPVRLVQATQLSEAADTSCYDLAFPEVDTCPMVPVSVPFGLVKPLSGDFCVCPELDAHALNYFDIYVEDPDLDEDDRPRDSIFGAFLLDYTPSSTDDIPSYIAYEHLLSPTTPAVPQQFGIGSYADAVERPEPQVRRFTIGSDTTPVDLCNDNASSPTSSKLSVGLHSLRLVVTDRPWYRPFELDASGEIELDASGEQVRVPAEQAALGVPDTPAGASYAIGEYVFRCREGRPPNAEPKPICDCREPETVPQ